MLFKVNNDDDDEIKKGTILEKLNNQEKDYLDDEFRIQTNDINVYIVNYGNIIGYQQV